MMSEMPDGHFSERYTDATGKGDIRIAGAGTFGMAMLLVSLSVLFAASILGFLIIRVRSDRWPPAGFPAIPRTLWISTVAIVLASVTIHRALRGVRRDDRQALNRNLLATFVLGMIFLLLQTINWVEFYWAIVEFFRTAKSQVRVEGPYFGMFFVLTALHAAHVVGGLIPLGIVLGSARKGEYSRNFHPGVRYVTIYWHFLDIVWIILFLLLWF